MKNLISTLKYKLILLIIILKRFLKIRHKRQTQDFFFIMGSGRNGSTLLASILNNHHQLFLPPEQYALPYTIEEWHLNPFKRWKTYSIEQLEKYATLNQNWSLTNLDYQEITKRVLKKSNEPIGPAFLIRNIFKLYAESKQKKGFKVIGDHSPISTTYYEYVISEFSQSKFIFLLRHPLDVILSYSKIPKNKAHNPEFACWKWNNSIKAYDYLISEGCEVLLILYEKFVRDPNHIISQIESFLGVKIIKLDGLRNSENDALGTAGMEIHKNLYNPINPNSINKWKKELNPELIKNLKPKLLKNAERFNYSLET